MMKLLKNKKPDMFLLLIVIAYAVLQFSAIFLYGGHWYLGSFEQMNNDDVKYIRSAWTLLEQHRLAYNDVNQPTVFIMPGYPFILAFFMKIFGKVEGITAVRVFQGILQIVSLCLVYAIARKIFNKRVARIAITLYLFYLPNVLTAGLILTEAVFTFLLVLLVYISILAVESKRLKYYAAGGVVLGLAVLIRPTILLFPIVILVMWLAYRYTLREMLGRSILVLCILITIMAPWWIRNYMAFSEFIPLTISSGNPFLQGTYVNYDQSKGRTPYVGYSKDAVQLDRIEMATGIQRLKENVPKEPFTYLYWYTLGKTIYLWICPYYYFNVFGVPFNFMVCFHLSLLFLALAGLIKAIAEKNKGGLLLLAVVLYFNLVHLPYFTSSRYAYPVMSFLIIFAANMLRFAGTGTSRK